MCGLLYDGQTNGISDTYLLTDAGGSVSQDLILIRLIAGLLVGTLINHDDGHFQPNSCLALCDWQHY
jgi:hypothetical protein